MAGSDEKTRLWDAIRMTPSRDSMTPARPMASLWADLQSGKLPQDPSEPGLPLAARSRQDTAGRRISMTNIPGCASARSNRPDSTTTTAATPTRTTATQNFSASNSLLLGHPGSGTNPKPAVPVAVPAISLSPRSGRSVSLVRALGHTEDMPSRPLRLFVALATR